MAGRDKTGKPQRGGGRKTPPASRVYRVTWAHQGYTLRAKSDLDAALAVLLLGDGQYGLERVDGCWEMPSFVPSYRVVVEAWLQAHAGLRGSLDAVARRRLSAMCSVLQSVVCGTAGERVRWDTMERRMKPWHFLAYSRAWHARMEMGASLRRRALRMAANAREVQAGSGGWWARLSGLDRAVGEREFAP